MVSLARPGGASGSTQSNASSFLQAKTRAVTAEAEMKQLGGYVSQLNTHTHAQWYHPDVEYATEGYGSNTHTRTLVNDKTIE